MNAPVSIKPFNAFAAYNREREANRLLYDLLNRSLMLLRSEADRRERNGEDVGDTRAFIAHAYSNAFAQDFAA